MRIALAQLNPTVGDIAGNTALVLDAVVRAREQGAALLVCPELAIIGYPPRDLLLREGVVRECEQAVRHVAAEAGDLIVVVGHPRRAAGGLRGLRNSASVCRGGEIVAVHDKRLLPGYDVFDEDRYFDAGDRTCIVDVGGARVGILTCEDLWQAGDVTAEPHYAVDPVAALVEHGCTLIASLNASPFIVGKFARHVVLVREAARRHRVPIAAVNQVGANDDLIFDGRSFLVDADGAVRGRLPGWEAAVETFDLEAAPGPAAPAAGAAAAPARPHPTEDLFHALVLAVRDYARKTGHERVLLGISGGVDSALTAALAVAALGPGRVTGVMMPSRYSSPEARADARDLAQRLGLDEPADVAIEGGHRAMTAALDPALPEDTPGITDENVQARLRGVILMALSNATGAIVLATSNKSELAVGYSTLYGDMCGALAVLGDVVKSRVYELARWLNENHDAAGFARPPIPPRSITKAPSAELRPNQTDQDSLPPYDVLDAIVERYVELEQTPDRISGETGFDPALVREIARRIDGAEYKRFQSAVIPKVTHRAFGRGRPMPIVMRETTAPGESAGEPAADRDRRVQS